jgi:DNA uptake protein ComE-like DNA-binding protein
MTIRSRSSDSVRVAAAALTVAALLLVVGGCSLFRVGGPPPQVDVNAADAQALARVPGIGPDEAQRIVAHRPYLEKDDLLRRHVLTEAQYAAVADHLSVGPPGVPEYLKSVPPMPEGP